MLRTAAKHSHAMLICTRNIVYNRKCAMSNATVKEEVFSIHDMKAHRGRRGTAPHILNLGTGWR